MKYITGFKCVLHLLYDRFIQNSSLCKLQYLWHNYDLILSEKYIKSNQCPARVTFSLNLCVSRAIPPTVRSHRPKTLPLLPRSKPVVGRQPITCQRPGHMGGQERQLNQQAWISRSAGGMCRFWPLGRHHWPLSHSSTTVILPRTCRPSTFTLLQCLNQWPCFHIHTEVGSGVVTSHTASVVP